MATTVQGSNATNHVAYLTLGGSRWGDYEDVDPPKISMDGEERFVAPGDSFESSGGGNYKVDNVTLKRHWKRSRDAALYQQFLNTAQGGGSLVGSLSYHEKSEDGSIDATPWITLNVLCTECVGATPSTKSGSSMFEVTVSAIGAPS